MREFTMTFGGVVDLDDPDTYKYLPSDPDTLRRLMLSEIGYAHCYMDYWGIDTYANPSDVEIIRGWIDMGSGKRVRRDSGQRARVEHLIRNFTEGWRANYGNVLWLQEQVFLFKDEIENMC